MDPDLGWMNAASDPNWLLSSVAQSAAALVAIVGGFLAARVIAFNSERDATRRRNTITDRDLRAAMREEARVQAELDDWDQNARKKREELEATLRRIREGIVRLTWDHGSVMQIASRPQARRAAGVYPVSVR